MSHRILTAAFLLLASVASIAAVLWFSASDARDARPAPSQFDIPWVEATSAHGLNVDRPPSVEVLREIVANEDATPELRAQAIYLMAKAQDWQGVEVLIEQLDDPAPLVRGRAAAAIRSILGTDFYYRAADDETRRSASIDGIRRYWQSRSSHPPISE